MRVRTGAVIVLAAACACVRRPAPGADLDSAAEAYVRIVLALAQRDPDSLDSYHGPAAWRADAEALRAPIGDVQRSASSLAQALGSRRDGDTARRAFLVRQLHAVDARADVLKGVRVSFDREFLLLFGSLGSPGSTGSRGSQGSSENPKNLENPSNHENQANRANPADLIPMSRLKAVFERAIEGCRMATTRYVTLPPGEHVTIEFVPDLSWSAFTDYLGDFHSRIRVNARVPMTVDDVLETACHEAYPGHHTIDALLDARFGGTRAEFLVQPLFSPQTLLHEGSASAAPALAFTDEERIAFERDELFPLAGLDPANAERGVRAAQARAGLRERELAIVRRYLDGELDFPRASEALAGALPGIAADDVLKFANQYRTYLATYSIGADAVNEWLDRQAPPHDRRGRWQAYQALVTAPGQTLPHPGVD